jgi:hypothetical protein
MGKYSNWRDEKARFIYRVKFPAKSLLPCEDTGRPPTETCNLNSGMKPGRNAITVTVGKH